jgi:hypothetical protein
MTPTTEECANNKHAGVPDGCSATIVVCACWCHEAPTVAIVTGVMGWNTTEPTTAQDIAGFLTNLGIHAYARLIGDEHVLIVSQSELTGDEIQNLWNLIQDLRTNE